MAALDRLGYGYVREHKVGRYSLDFAMPDMRFDLEVDGVYWHDPEKDARRDAFLTKRGWTVHRITDTVVMERSDEELDGMLYHDFGLLGVGVVMPADEYAEIAAVFSEV